MATLFSKGNGNASIASTEFILLVSSRSTATEEPGNAKRAHVGRTTHRQVVPYLSVGGGGGGVHAATSLGARTGRTDGGRVSQRAVARLSWRRRVGRVFISPARARLAGDAATYAPL